MKWRLLSGFTIFIILSLPLMAYETKGEFSPLGDEIRSLDQGEIFDGRIRLWPLDAYIDSELREDLLSRPFLQFFKVLKVVSIEKNKENNEVVDIYLKAAVARPIPPRSQSPDGKELFFIWSYKGLNIPITLKKMMAGKSYQPKELSFLPIPPRDVFKAKFSTGWTIFFSLVVAIGMLAFGLFLKKKIEKKREKEKREKERQQIMSLFQHARERADYEQLYEERNKWPKTTPEEEELVKELMGAIENIQYKRFWADEEFEYLEKKTQDLLNIWNN